MFPSPSILVSISLPTFSAHCMCPIKAAYAEGGLFLHTPACWEDTEPDMPTGQVQNSEVERVVFHQTFLGDNRVEGEIRKQDRLEPLVGRHFVPSWSGTRVARYFVRFVCVSFFSASAALTG